MKNEKHEAKKQEILESAFRIWGECRYQNTSLSDLAAAHGMTKQAIYRYFSSKARLEDAMEEAAVSQFLRSTDEIRSHLESCKPEEFPEVYARDTIRFMKKKGYQVAFLSYRYRREPEMHPVILHLQKEMTELASERAGIPEVGMRYLNALVLMEFHSRKTGNWEEAWYRGFGTENLTESPRFDQLLADASRLDFGVFTEDPIVRAVFEAVLEEGGNGVSLGKVARKAGLTKSSLYNYWPSKEAMLSDVLRRQVKVFSDLFDSYASEYSEPADRLFAYLAFTGSFFRRTPEILNYMQRVMSFGINPPREGSGTAGSYLQSLRTVLDAGVLDLGDYPPSKFLGLANLATVSEIKYHLAEGSARIRIDQCLKDLYLLIAGGISALRRTM